MFQGMFRKRGRPPDPPLQIGGYDKPSHEESNQIPVHQLRDAPRQLPLPAVREFEQSTDLQQEQPGFSNAIVESSSLPQQHDVDMLDSHHRHLSQTQGQCRMEYKFHPLWGLLENNASGKVQSSELLLENILVGEQCCAQFDPLSFGWGTVRMQSSIL